MRKYSKTIIRYPSMPYNGKEEKRAIRGLHYNGLVLRRLQFRHLVSDVKHQAFHSSCPCLLQAGALRTCAAKWETWVHRRLRSSRLNRN
jgi:hypothetical protein